MLTAELHRSAAEMRPEIELAWKRATLAGLDPGMPVRETLVVSDFDRRSRLVTAATPVLDRMIDDLSGTRFALLLCDREAIIVDRRLGASGMGSAADRARAVPGVQYLEETSGTNALATAFELRQPISVVGEEHFLEALRSLCCYGAPIVHPLTKRLEGVLDISGPAGDATGLLRSLLIRAVSDIEQELLAGARLAEQRLLAEFQAHTRQRRHAVVALGEDIVLASPAAIDLVSSADHALLRAVSSELTNGGSMQLDLRLSSGADVTVRARSAGGGGGVLIDLVETRRASVPSTAVPTLPPPIADVVLIVGEPGAGRTTEGHSLAGEDALVVDGGAQDVEFDELRRAINEGCAVLIDDVHLLDPRTAARLAFAVRGCSNRVVMTSSAVTELVGEQSALAAMAMERIELRPLRCRREEFAAHIADILSEMCSGGGLRLTPSAVAVLAAQSWPGNFRELKSVLAHAARGRTFGDITEADLPPAYRLAPLHSLSLIEIAERDAILAAMRTADGNKSVAAELLGIGRTTLYARLRRYRITGFPGAR